MTFDTEKTVDYWREASEYDLETARILLQKERFPSALFFGHLALEKLLKALVVRVTQAHAPLIHNLEKLSLLTGLAVTEDFARDLDHITDFNIEGRYPEIKRKLHAECTPEFTRRNMARIEEIHRWFLAKL